MRQLFQKTESSKVVINFTESTQKKINEAIIKNLHYAVINISGDSMTCMDVNISIPDKSKILICDLGIDLQKGIFNIWHEIPTKKAVVISGVTSNGKEFRVCKIIECVDVINEKVLLKSLNVKHAPQWVPFVWINDIYEVLQIVE